MKSFYMFLEINPMISPKRYEPIRQVLVEAGFSLVRQSSCYEWIYPSYGEENNTITLRITAQGISIMSSRLVSDECPHGYAWLSIVRASPEKLKAIAIRATKLALGDIT